MASLVADYGTSGSDSETNDDNVSDNINDDFFKEDEKEIEQIKENEEKEEAEESKGNNSEDKEDDNSYLVRTTEPASSEKLPLPTPDFDSATTLLRTSVFSNPFVEAERAKSAILEKHVKMTPTLDDTKTINGRKICWNYRKGRCRFGHNCAFAHDSDLHRSAAELEVLRAPQETLVCQTRYNGQQQWQQQQQQQQSPNDAGDDENDEVDQENNQTGNNRKRKKRPGLSQWLLPSKRVFKLYKAQQTKTVDEYC
ncbi:zinc finger CCCH domain-containing protein 65 [Harpegnathos saltator]|uniref:C3H1-type domain-containing protein n=1 Tax=Harpegnathos saltator TaxID=610380 RepID=E2B3I3_HARSA|nr:zinc finger CCCH domain-containing protein 65 [Harpegnathos saltator]EFN89735.1 hypothetical protein EAI_01983 [Harpegnathos saltator]